jgi:predicted dehydrogenase
MVAFKASWRGTQKMDTRERSDIQDVRGTAANTQAGVGALGGITFLPRTERVFGANDRVRVAVVGLRGQGFLHVEEYAAIPNVEIAAVCEVDENILKKRLADMEKMALPQPKTFFDVRKLMEDTSIDAVSIATPNHWHALIAIWACQAGKDVYVEKPCSHNWWEGRQMVEAAAKYHRIVQHGTNMRTSPAVREGIQKLHEGVVGDVYMARGLCYCRRPSIGRAPIEQVPPGVHYDIWIGPAPAKPFTQNRFHYNWHWFWDTGNGDVGNQGIHYMDVARWGLGVKLPNKVSAIGGHFMFDDDQETPNTLNCSFQFDMPDGKRKLLVMEVRHWITNHEANIDTPGFGLIIPNFLGYPDPRSERRQFSGQTVGDIFYGPKGYLAIAHGGRDFYRTWLGEDQEPGPTRGEYEGSCWANFIEAVRSRKKEDLHAPIEEGHYSCTLVHLANASYRLGRTLNFDPATEQVIGDEEAARLLRGGYREPFVVPEKV